MYEDIISGEINNTLIDKKVEKVIDTDPIYIMYTSGSTGVPKGVTISHRGVVDFVKWVVDVFDFDRDTIIANQSPFHFDNSIFEIYSCMLSGGKMILMPEILMMFPLKIPEFLKEKK